jgi:glycosyltransferase involved in cell wall biosynthesis
VLGGSDILAFPSHLNGPGRAVFEAGMHGIPAVVALRVSVDDVIQDGETGLVVPPRDPARLADAIVRLADDPELRWRLGRAARSRYAAQFDPGAAGCRMLEIYRQVATRAVAD